MGSILLVPLLAVCVAWGEEPPAGEAEKPLDFTADLEQFAVEMMQLDQSVVSSTKTAQRSAQTPAVISVVTADEIQARGYGDLAEVLRSVPGLYDVYDLVTHNVGLRGINGGARASGGVIKLMIDGQPVDYRSSTGNFFGEELIPLHIVDRIEVIRGPASALYGANAFLGVVNIITKSGAKASGARLSARGVMVRGRPGGGGAFSVGGASGPVEVLLAAGAAGIDRSGLALPSTSPVLSRVVWPPPPIPYAGRGLSLDDWNRPKSAFAKVSVDGIARGRVSFLATLQNLDSAGEFQDFSTLSHGNRISLLNQNYRLSYDISWGDKASLQVSLHYLSGGPSPSERLHVLRDDLLLLRNAGVEGYGTAVEARVAAHERLTLTMGADLQQEMHKLQTFDQLLTEDIIAPDGTVLRTAGTIIPGRDQGAQARFRNLAAFGQGVLSLDERWSVTAGARIDYHNVYGINPSGRVGVVYAPPEQRLSLKLLYGSSFKAPSAIQLYTQPIGLADVRGNPNLKAQTANTVELAAGYGLPDERGEITLNLFAMNVAGRVEFVQRGLFVQAHNILDEWVVGGEADFRYKVSRPLVLRLAAGVARTVAHSTGTLLTGAPEVTNSLFPSIQAHLVGDYSLPWWGLRVSAEVSYIGPRTSSQSNALANGEAYVVPGYVYTAAALSSPTRKLFGDTETSASLRVVNLLNQAWIEPGFSGIDVPVPRRTISLTLNQSF